MQVESCVWHCVFLTHTATARYFNMVWNHHITLVKGWFQSVSSKNEIMLRWRNVCAGVLITHQKIWTEQYPPISTVYPSAGVHPRASVLKDVLLCARWSAVWFGHVCVCAACTCLHLHLCEEEEEEENKGGWQLCKMETVSVLVKPRGASYTMFWQANLITGLFMLLSLQPGVSERACMRVFICGRGGGSWYKAYKTSRLKEWLFISLKNRMSSFFPTESENHVMFLLCGGFAFVCVRVCSKAKVLKTSQFI